MVPSGSPSLPPTLGRYFDTVRPTRPVILKLARLNNAHLGLFTPAHLLKGVPDNATLAPPYGNPDAPAKLIAHVVSDVTCKPAHKPAICTMRTLTSAHTMRIKPAVSAICTRP